MEYRIATILTNKLIDYGIYIAEQRCNKTKV